jgi:hypothetical protein
METKELPAGTLTFLFTDIRARRAYFARWARPTPTCSRPTTT